MRTSFDKWNTNYLQRLAEQKQSDNWEEDRKEAYLLNLFLSKRVFIYGFYRHITKQIQTNSVVQRQRKFLIKAIIQSMVHPEGVTAKDLEKTIESDEGYTYTHTRRMINDDYPEMFMESEKKKKDARFTPFRTVFSLQELPEEYKAKLWKTVENTYQHMKSRPDLTEWLLLNAGIMPVTPEYLLDLRNFLIDIQEVLRKIQIDSKNKQVLQKEMKGLTEISGEFSNHFQSMMAVEWWRNRQQKTKRWLIDDGFPFKYTRSDATKAHELLLEITESPEQTYSIMFGSALTFNDRELPEQAQFLYEECLKMDYPNHLDRGILHENIATMLRKQNKPKLMVREMKKALEHFQQTNNKYRVCVALKNLGEAEWNLGFKEAGLGYFSEAESLCDTLDHPKIAWVYWNLACASRRIGEKKMECDYLLKCMTNSTDEQTKLILECEQRMSELMC